MVMIFDNIHTPIYHPINVNFYNIATLIFNQHKIAIFRLHRLRSLPFFQRLA